MELPDHALTNEVSPQELEALLAAGTVRLIDCREDDEFTICRIEGSTLIPLKQIPEKLELVRGGGEQPLVIYCHHGMRSLHATQFLRSRGIEQVFSLRGGIDAWSDSIDSTVPRY
ncbi:MAG: rhodanese-related sulfurtransferase [Verrucomicrobiales bacterium]|jgi:rhodanese-related sulfurtransferase